MIDEKKVLARADALYREAKVRKGWTSYGVRVGTDYGVCGMPSDQIRALCSALVEAVNEELKELRGA